MRSQSIFDIAFAGVNPCRKKYRIDYCGVWNDTNVMAITDCMGPQVVVSGKVLSPPQKSHKEAIAHGKRLVSGEIQPNNKWTNLAS